MRLVKILGGSCCGLMLMLLCNACADNSEIIELNDQEYIILSLNSADLNSDGEISEKEASSIKSLYITEGIIEIIESMPDDGGDVDLLGILRYCTSLETLIISSIDGSLSQSLDLSNNRQLKRLYCENPELEHLDISQNENLEFLYLCGNGGLSELDLSRNRKLRELYVVYADISELNLSNNRDLRGLYIDSADLSELDLSNNPELRKLHCIYTDLSELDLRNNRELRELNVEETYISELDLSNNRELRAARTVRFWDRYFRS